MNLSDRHWHKTGDQGEDFEPLSVELRTKVNRRLCGFLSDWSTPSVLQSSLHLSKDNLDTIDNIHSINTLYLRSASSNNLGSDESLWNLFYSTWSFEGPESVVPLGQCPLLPTASDLLCRSVMVQQPQCTFGSCYQYALASLSLSLSLCLSLCLSLSLSTTLHFSQRLIMA